MRTGDYDAVDELTARALVAARDTGDRTLEADAFAVQGMTLHFRAIELPPERRAAIDPAPEQELFDRALSIRRDLDDRVGIAESLFQLGLVYQVLRRDLEAAAPYIREALGVLETAPDADDLLRSEIHRHIGFDLLLRQDRPAEAREHLRVSLELREPLPEQGWIASAHVALSLCERLAGRRADAIAYARQALDVAEAQALHERFGAAAQNALQDAEAMPNSGTAP